MNVIIRSLILAFIAVATGGHLSAQTLTNLGAAAPSPGTSDIYQLPTSGNTTWPDGINYFTDNDPPVGQKFTTGTNALKLVSVALKTAGLFSGGNYGTPANTPTYYLRIYSMSNTTASLLLSVSAPNPGFTDGNWLKWSGLNVPLGTNKTYAYTFGRQPSGGGYAALAVATNKYSGGEIVTIPINGGTIATGSSHSFDAVFDLGLQPATPNIPANMPLPTPTYGFNLGNSLEAIWGFSYPSAAPLYTAANAGFNAVRIPCAWDFNATTNGNAYPINATYMANVKRTVDYAIAAGLYVVINAHWDNGWLDANLTTNIDPVVNAKMNSYWTQIATTFAGYDNHLLFAAANEPPVDSPDEMKTMMYYYQTFVNAVRGAGGYNTNRWLVLQSVSDPTWLNALPTDTVTNRIMVEYHCYTPFQFTQLQGNASWGDMQYFWGPAYHYSGNPSRNCGSPEEGAIDSGFQQLTDMYISKGIPVLVGEFQAAAKSVLVTNATEAAWNSASALYWNKYVGESARAHGLSPFYWSTPDSPFVYDTGAITDTQAVSVLTGGIAPPPPNGAPYAASGLTATVSNNNNVVLSWAAGSGATSYSLYRANQSGFESAIAPFITGLTSTNYTDTNLNSGTTYYYQVVAVNNSGPGGFSAEAHATTTGVNPDPAQFNFETDPQLWSGGGGIIAGIATSTAQHYAGNQSLAVYFNGTNANSSSVSVGNMTVLPGMTVTFRVWIPSGHKISNLQPYMQDKNYSWASSWYESFTANAWNTVALTVPGNAVAPFQNFGIQFATSAGWTNTCYIDSVSWSDPAPDFSVAANPTSLTVNGGTNGTSTITVTASNGLNAVYTLIVSNLPSGVSAVFATNPITGGASLLTLTASNTVTSGTSNVTVIATAGLLTHTTTVALTLNGITQPNTPPTLAAITNRTTNVGQTVAFTASAADTNQPPQTLTFSLLAGSGAATLNPNSGAFSWTPQASDAGTSNWFSLKVADSGTPSLSATQSFYVTVNKQTPVLTTPVASAITYGQTLANSTLSGGAATNSANNASVAGSFAFTTPATAPGAGTASQSVTFTPTDTAHYNPATVNVSVTVNKRTPVLTAPVASAITYGQTLTNSTLSGGAATNSANNVSVAGSFAFTTPATTPGAGTASQSVTFTPTDTANYNPATVNVSVTVSQASPTLEFSSSKNPSGYNEGVIFTASLPTNATGNVNFLTNGVLFVARTLSGGSATATNSTLPTGTNLITAIYSGDSNHLGRTNALNQVVTNTPPALAAISDQTVNVGQTVAFTASATDTDSPSQTLTFALLTGAANATLNTNSGAFSFRPLVTQANSTNSFTLEVSDNGAPSLSATQSFTVTVNPLTQPDISNISFVGGQISFSVSGQSGPDYAIETSTNLTQWSNVFITNSPTLPFNWTDATTNSPQRFYRIKLGPPLP